MFTPHWLRFLPTVRHLQLFIWVIFCPVVKCYFIFGFSYIDLYSICITFGVQKTGERICRENRHWSSAVTGSPRTILKKTSSCILTRRVPRTPKMMEVAHNTPIAIWLMIMTVQCTWSEERLQVDSYSSFRWTLQKFAISLMWLREFCPLVIHFAIINALILCTDDLAFTLWVMFSLKDFVPLLGQWTYYF